MQGPQQISVLLSVFGVLKPSDLLPRMIGNSLLTSAGAPKLIHGAQASSLTGSRFLLDHDPQASWKVSLTLFGWSNRFGLI